MRDTLDGTDGNIAACVDAEDFGMEATSTTSTFACILQVTCRRGKHRFLVQPPGRNTAKEKGSAAVGKDEKQQTESPGTTYQIRDYGINYLAFLLMQIMGNGITSLDTMMGMFGLGIHSGSHKERAYIASELGVVEQKRADKIQNQNILIKIAATKSRHATVDAASNWKYVILPCRLQLAMTFGVTQRHHHPGTFVCLTFPHSPMHQQL